MRLVSILVNVVLSLFTLLVLVTDGPPTDPRFIAYSLFLLLVPLLTAVVLRRFGRFNAPRSLSLGWAAVSCNVVLLVASCVTVATQYPAHPPEAGLLPYVVILLVAPTISLVALGRDLWRPAGRQVVAG